MCIRLCVLYLSKTINQTRRISTTSRTCTRFLKLKAIVYHGQSPIKWIPCLNGQRPPGAVEGGYEGNKRLHVIRAVHEGGLYPGKLNCTEEMAYIANLGKEHARIIYEVLVAPYASVKWTPWKDEEQVVSNAVLGGVCESGNTLHIGRAIHNNCLVIGKVDAKHEICYIPYKGFVYGYKEFDILTQTNPETERFTNFADID